MREKREMDGNQAAAEAAYFYSDVAAVYPITPSTGMAEYVEEWTAAGRKNMFGRPVEVTQLQSEAGAAGTMHGALLSGALTVTFTASQGLLLMLPNLYRMVGERLPGVFHVAARSIATHALSIYGDHSDIYACRQTGAAFLCAGSVQEVMDLAPIAHIAAVRARLPFIHFFDGFRTSHEIQKIEVWDERELEALADREAIRDFRKSALTPEHGKQMGSSQEPNVFFQCREAENRAYEKLPELVQTCMDRVNARIKTGYRLFEYYGAPDADHVIAAMGSVCGAIEETVDSLNRAGKRTGLIKVRLYRPFCAARFAEALPDTVRILTVLDRTKEPGSVGEPLYLDVRAALGEAGREDIRVFRGRYGLASKDTTPAQLAAVFLNEEKECFTIGIDDDVTHLSLKPVSAIRTEADACRSFKFWGLGGDGTVGANKNSVKIIGDFTELYAQAYFAYDSKKSRGLTISHIRLSEKPIRSSYLISRTDFAACHNPAYLHKYDIVQEIRDGGVFLLNCPYEGEALESWLPGRVKRYLAEHRIRFFVIDGIGIGKEIGLNSRINTILQAAFFKVCGVLPKEEALRLMKEFAGKAYRQKGDRIVEMNDRAIEWGMRAVREAAVPERWKDAPEEEREERLLPGRPELLDFVRHIQRPMERQQGDALPVSAFLPYRDGGAPSGSTAHERRNTAVEIPVWKPENCIQCNFCSYVCPHAVIRPFVLDREEQDHAPKGMKILPMAGLSEEGYGFCVAVSETDCTGCGSCAGVCPGKQGKKALEMIPAGKHTERQDFFDYGKSLSEKPKVWEAFQENTVKGVQFKKPFLEFHGACAGCGETPYARLATQLFGERMYIANATGCSSIWGYSYPSTPYTVNERGQGPAWANSLFEDAAEFGYGMFLAGTVARERARETGEALLARLNEEGRERTEDPLTEKIRERLAGWLATLDRPEENRRASKSLADALSKWRAERKETGKEGELRGGRKNNRAIDPQIQALWEEREHFAKKSYWVFGGDGWAYDIGFSGLDHILATGADVNLLVFDTQVYSNTGGQASKATPQGAAVRLASNGKQTRKKDLAAMAMTYKTAYVAQIAMGADYSQTLKAFLEAESYPGPSLLIAYAPCISHGLRAGLGSSQHEEKKAVEAGYWHLFRFHPERAARGENPFLLDSKAPAMDYREFLSGELRYTALEGKEPERAARLFESAAANAREKYEEYKRMAE